jgi:hypothetical protein
VNESPTSLEREVARLGRRVDQAGKELERLRAAGQEPRGMVHGLAVGMVLSFVFYLVVAWMLGLVTGSHGTS